MFLDLELVFDIYLKHNKAWKLISTLLEACWQTLQIWHFVNPFDGCQKMFTENVSLLAAQMLYESSSMIDNLLRASPELVM